MGTAVPSLLQMFSSVQAHGELCSFAPTVTQSSEAKIQSGYRRALLATSTRTIFRFSNFLKN